MTECHLASLSHGVRREEGENEELGGIFPGAEDS